MNYNRRILSGFILLGILQLSKQFCYIVKPLNISTWDTPNYNLLLKMYPRNNSLSSITSVHKDVAIPLWHIVLVQHPSKRRGSSRAEPSRTLYNSTVKTCEFWKYMRRVSAWYNISKLMLSGYGSNMSLACPLKRGVYMMNVIQVPPDTAILKFMYQPNNVYTIHGTVYSLNPKDGVTKRAICYYEVNITIYKNC
ncbi:GH12069 [Drosophila grimshawi]|uniref:GH12069 n=1 Tax=Drosophila grimshawi TaxID=7222 RepID=B4JKD7_DROGR|nr:GH12069 [Drosophila grimshawi]